MCRSIIALFISDLKKKKLLNLNKCHCIAPKLWTEFFSISCNHSMYQKRAWQSTSNTSVPFCMQPLKHRQGNLMTWCPGYWLEMKDKLMSPCNFGCFECIEGNQHVKEFWSHLELLKYQGCSRCDGLALWMSNLTCLCVLQCICAHMCQWSCGSVGSCSTIYEMYNEVVCVRIPCWVFLLLHVFNPV